MFFEDYKHTAWDLFPWLHDFWIVSLNFAEQMTPHHPAGGCQTVLWFVTQKNWGLID